MNDPTITRDHAEMRSLIRIALVVSVRLARGFAPPGTSMFIMVTQNEALRLIDGLHPDIELLLFWEGEHLFLSPTFTKGAIIEH